MVTPAVGKQMKVIRRSFHQVFRRFIQRDNVSVASIGLLGLFSAEITGADFVLTPATDLDMRGKNAVVKPSLEVVYDNV